MAGGKRVPLGCLGYDEPMRILVDCITSAQRFMLTTTEYVEIRVVRTPSTCVQKSGI